MRRKKFAKSEKKYSKKEKKFSMQTHYEYRNGKKAHVENRKFQRKAIRDSNPLQLI